MHLGGFVLAGLLYLGAAVAVAPFCFRGGSRARCRDPKHMLNLVGAVVFGGILGPVLLLAGLSQASAGSVSLWLNLEAVATAMLGALFFREQIGISTWLAVTCIVAAGMLLTIGDPGATVIPALLVSGACICWGLDNSFTSLIDGLTPAQSTFVKGLVAGSMNLGLGLLLADVELSLELVAKSLAVGALCYGASIVLYIRGAQELGATRSQLLFSAAPFVGLASSWILLGEAIETPQVIAAGIMAGGIFLLISSQHQHEHQHDELTHSHSHRHDDGHHAHRHEGLADSTRHTHEHTHESQQHSHEHLPDLHHRHEH